jgi:hypothetical protein
MRLCRIGVKIEAYNLLQDGETAVRAIPLPGRFRRKNSAAGSPRS